MPRTKLDPKNGKHRDLGVLVNGAFAMDKKGLEDISRILGTSQPTASKYLKNPEKLSSEELSKLGRNLGIPIEALREAAIRY